MSRLITGAKAALRALIPVIVVEVAQVQAGTVKRWSDLFTLQNLAAVAAALLAKGAYGAALEHKDK